MSLGSVRGSGYSVPRFELSCLPFVFALSPQGPNQWYTNKSVQVFVV